MVLSSFLPLAVLLIATGSVQAGKNDWTKPCHMGSCHYDIKGDTSASLSIMGSPSAISDITTAGGWTILDCDPNTRIQDVRALCHSEKCQHLYNGHGAVNTIVRLPENCTDVPFARVAREWKHRNQTVPAHIQQNIKRGLSDAIRGLSLDTNFHSVNADTTGEVAFVIQGTSKSGGNGNFTVTPVISSRGLGSSIEHALEGLDSVSVKKDGSFPIKYDKSVTLLDQSLNCPQTGNVPAFNGGVKIAAQAKADASVSYGVAAAGTIVPPKLTNFGIVAGLDGGLNGVLTVNATAAGNVEFSKTTIFSMGLPGLSVPAILDIGPIFQVSASGNAKLDAQVNFGLDLAYKIDGAKLAFPPTTGSSGGSFSPGDMAVSVAATPNAAVSGAVEVHLIPAVLFGINAFNGAGKANINLALDSSANLKLNLEASALATASTGGTGSSSAASATFNGCTNVDAGLSVSANADAKLFDVFDKSTTVNIFQKSFDVVDKCTSGSTKRSSSFGERKHARDIARRGLTCPAIASGVTDIVAEIVSAVHLS